MGWVPVLNFEQFFLFQALWLTFHLYVFAESKSNNSKYLRYIIFNQSHFFQERKTINIIRGQFFFPIPSVFFCMWNLSLSFHRTSTAPLPTHPQEGKHVICEFGSRKCMDSSAPPYFFILGSGDSSLLLWEPILLLLGNIGYGPVPLCGNMCNLIVQY